MARILLLLQLLIIVVLLGTCERHDMFELATIGQAPNKAIYLYFLPNARPGSLGGRNGADTACYNEGLMYYKFLKAATVKAFLSVSPTDEVRFLVPPDFWSYPVAGIDSSFAVTTISDSWHALWSGSIKTSLASALGMPPSPPYWWAGSNVDGSFSSGASCDQWSQANTTTGNVGDQVIVGANWIGPPTPPQSCDSAQFVICLAY